MIRKIPLLAGTVALAATSLAGVAATAGSTVAGAAKGPYLTTTCGLTGSVSFPSPGLTHDGTLPNKATVNCSSAITPTSGACGTSTIKSKTVLATVVCATAAVVARARPSGAVAKNPRYCATVPLLLVNGTTNIVNSLSVKGSKAQDNGNKVTLQVTSAGAARVPTNGACGTTPGFNVPGLTYSSLLCLGGDAGTGTTRPSTPTPSLSWPAPGSPSPRRRSRPTGTWPSPRPADRSVRAPGREERRAARRGRSRGPRLRLDGHRGVHLEPTVGMRFDDHESVRGGHPRTGPRQPAEGRCDPDGGVAR